MSEKHYWLPKKYGRWACFQPVVIDAIFVE